VRKKLKNFYETRYRRVGKGIIYEKWVKLIVNIVGNYKTSVSSLLDIGCGDGTCTSALKTVLHANEAYGIDISELAVRLAIKKGIHAIRLDIGTQSLPFFNNYFDFIFCGETIEHIFDTDHLLSEAYRVLKTGGTLYITTPNLASWFNRLALLLGYQPTWAEVSIHHDVGKLKFMGTKPCGHIRVFTPKALVELLQIHGFKNIKLCSNTASKVGIPKIVKALTQPIDLTLCRIRPSLSQHIIVLCSK